MSTTSGGLAALFALLVAPTSWAGMTASPNPSVGSHTISWDYPPAGVSQFRIYETVNGGNVYLDGVIVYSGLGSAVNLTGRVVGTYTYTLFVCFPLFGDLLCVPAYDPANPTLWTANVTVAVPTPGPISGPSTDADGAYTINWGATTPPATSYELQEKVGSGSWTSIQNTSATNKAISR